MSATLNQGSAKIYQFPTGGRAALGGRSYGEAKASIDQNTSRVYEAALCSDSWYHEEAVQEARSESKPARDH